MKVKPTAIPGVVVVTPQKFGDNRGYFVETYNAALFAQAGIDAVFVQDNQSFSAARGTTRGLHFQTPPAAQSKLVRVIQGAIFDVAVDIRVGSPTFGRWVGEVLSAEAGEQLFIPAGFAHGFRTLTRDVIVAYKVDHLYSREHDAGIAFADPAIGIAWPDVGGEVTLSDRDRGLPKLADFASPFVYSR